MKSIVIKIIAISIFPLMASISPILAQERSQGYEIAKLTDERDDGAHVIQTLTMELIDKRGKKRTRTTTAYRKYFGEERRQAIFYKEPSNIRGTAFLVYDYPEKGKDNDQWLYLPALRKTRRISASNRGDYFLGTDMTYEDINLGNKLSLEDYTYTFLEKEQVEGHDCYLIEGIPVDIKTAKELGYSKTHAWVDTKNAMIRKAAYWDIAGNHLKTLEVSEIRLVNDIWTGHTLKIVNHKTGHQTSFFFSEVDYQSEVSDELFTEQSLVRGL